MGISERKIVGQLLSMELKVLRAYPRFSTSRWCILWLRNDNEKWVPLHQIVKIKWCKDSLFTNLWDGWGVICEHQFRYINGCWRQRHVFKADALNPKSICSIFSELCAIELLKFWLSESRQYNEIDVSGSVCIWFHLNRNFWTLLGDKSRQSAVET